MEMVLVLVIFDFIASIKNVEGKKNLNFGAFGARFQNFQLLFKMCQAAAKREKIITIESV